MKLNSDQKKTISSILADLGKLIFFSFVIGRFVSEVKVPDYLFIIGIAGTFFLLILSIIVLKE